MATRSKSSVKKKAPLSAVIPLRKRESSLHALSTADEPRHPAPALVLYRLLKLSNLINQPFFADDAARYSIGMNELRVLLTLASRGEAAGHEVGALAGMHPMNVSRAVAALSRQKRIQQRPDPGNRRRKLLALTSKGWKLHEDLMPHVREVANSLFATLEPAELDVLDVLIDKMTARLEQNVPSGATQISQS